MALTVDYLYNFALKLIRKNQSGSLSADDFAKHWNDASSSYFDDILGRFQSRNTGKEGANTGLIQNKTLLQKLAPFTKEDTLTIAAGETDKPTDFAYELALRIGGKDVIHINHDQKAAVANNVIDPPSEANGKYYVTEFENYYSFLPTTVTSVDIDYIRFPVDIKWGYTFDSNGRQVYASGSSTQPEWDNNSCREITKRMLTNIGISLKDNDFLNFGKSVQATGE